MLAMISTAHSTVVGADVHAKAEPEEEEAVEDVTSNAEKLTSGLGCLSPDEESEEEGGHRDMCTLKPSVKLYMMRWVTRGE